MDSIITSFFFYFSNLETQVVAVGPLGAGQAAPLAEMQLGRQARAAWARALHAI